MKYILIALFLLISASAFGQGAALFQGGEPITPEDPTGQLLNLFGVDVESFIWLSAFVLFATAIVKRKFPDTWLGGWKTDVVALVIATLISFKLYWPAWQPILVSSIGAWLLPAGTFALIKNFLDGGLTDQPKEPTPTKPTL